MLGSNSLDLSFEEADVTKQTRLYYAQTESSRWKKRALENVYDLFSDLESDEEGMIRTLMLVYHSHKPVFTPKMAIFRTAGMRKGGLPLPLAFQYLIILI